MPTSHAGPATAGRTRLVTPRAAVNNRVVSHSHPEPDAPDTARPLMPLGGGLRRIPVRRRNEIIFVSVDSIATVIADGELLQITTRTGDRHVITYRLKDLEARLDPAQFVRLSRGALANVDLIERVTPMSGGTYVVTLATGQQLAVSRMRARVLRDQ